jgi:hypothetical protein
MHSFKENMSHSPIEGYILRVSSKFENRSYAK